MRKFLIIFLLMIASPAMQSQELLMDTEDVHDADVMEPKFNGGGLDKFYEFIKGEFDFSKVTKTGRLLFSFTITTEGEMKNLRVLKSPNSEAAIELIRVLDLAPKWIPAKRAGKPFSTEIKFPMDFK